ncbi:hypothetical protein [Streptomyces sp. NPDC101150]|uniref:hypothetical protein n=1 Tax=Streptomyces sp. NPDC101150 TaxID=3366114 RepID=UPI0038230330
MAEGEHIRLVVGEEFRRVVMALREMDASLPKELRKELRQAARPLAQRAKDRVRSIPTRGRGHTGLRARVARGVGIRAAVGRNPAVKITTSMTNPDEAAIPRGLDSPRGWRHPVFGNRNKWVSQHTYGPWFMETMREGGDDIKRDVKQVMDEAANRVARAGGA